MSCWPGTLQGQTCWSGILHDPTYQFYERNALIAVPGVGQDQKQGKMENWRQTGKSSSLACLEAVEGEWRLELRTQTGQASG